MALRRGSVIADVMETCIFWRVQSGSSHVCLVTFRPGLAMGVHFAIRMNKQQEQRHVNRKFSAHFRETVTMLLLEVQERKRVNSRWECRSRALSAEVMVSKESLKIFNQEMWHNMNSLEMLPSGFTLILKKLTYIRWKLGKVWRKVLHTQTAVLPMRRAAATSTQVKDPYNQSHCFAQPAGFFLPFCSWGWDWRFLGKFALTGP